MRLRKLSRKVAAGVMAVAMCVTAVPWTEMPVLVHAQESVDEGVPEGLEYAIDGDGVKITRYTGSAAELVIPEEIEGVKVTSMGENAFCECSSLTSVKIPNGIKMITMGAFAGCDNLTSIEIPMSVMCIGDSAFYRCHNLKDIYYIGSPGYWTSIDIVSKEELANVTIHYCEHTDTTTDEYGNISCQRCGELLSEKIYESGDFNYSIHDNGVYIVGYRGADEEIEIPEKLDGINVTQIGNNAFSGNKSLVGIIIPKGITQIGNNAFYECNELSDIYYTGSWEQWEQIDIGWGNEILSEWYMTKHYDICLHKNMTEDEYGNSYCPDCEKFLSEKVYESGDFKYIKHDEGVYIVGYIGSGKKAVIPAKLDGMAVVQIGRRAFLENETLVEVVISEGVTSIGDFAFSHCYEMMSIEIPASVMSIGDGVFDGCNRLTSIEIPASVTSIGNEAFSNCSSLVSIKIPDGVTRIECGMFEGCGLTSIEIPESVTSIGNGAFRNCSSLESIEIPKSVRELYGDTFYGCNNLVSIIVDKNNEVYDSRNNCNAIIESEYNRLVAGCKNTIIPENVRYIGWSSFSGCRGLAYIEIPESVVGIAEGAFSGCSSLAAISIPLSVTSIGDGAFDECYELEEVYYTGSQEQWEQINIGSDNGCLKYYATIHYNSCTHKNETEDEYGNLYCPDCGELISSKIYTTEDFQYIKCDKGVYIVGYSGTLSKVVIPDKVDGIKVAQIGPEAFKGCDTITEITIPESVTSIGESAFSYCNSLKSIDIPDGVTRIEERVFAHCRSLENIEIPINVTSIGGWAFSGCGLLGSIVIMENVTSIGEGAFCNCSMLENVYYTGMQEQWGKIDISYGWETELYGEDSLLDATIHFNSCTHKDKVEGEYGDLYCAECGQIISKKIYESEGVKFVRYADGMSVVGYSDLQSEVIIPKEIEGVMVTRIGRGAFDGCRSMTGIIIPEGVTDIERLAFSQCSELVSVELPATLTYIGDKAFLCCENLRDVKSNTTMQLEYVGEWAFTDTYWFCNSDYVELGGLVLKCKPIDAEEKKFYFDNSQTQWDEVYVWAWHEDAMWILDNGFGEWPGIKIDIDEATGYYVCQCDNYEPGVGIIFSENGGSHIKDAVAKTAVLNSVFIPTEQDDDGQWYGEWKPIVPTVCKHENTELRNEKSATCTTNGYTGDTYCKDCNELIAMGKEIPATGHNNTEIINQKSATYTAEGYTGDTYCKDCKQTIAKGKAIAKLPKTSIKDAKVTGIVSKKYNGKAQTQSITVTLGGKILKSGTDYEVTYRNNINVGTATVTITGKGDYTGTLPKTFKIEAVKVATVSSLKQKDSYETNKVILTWAKATGVTGYEVLRSTSKNGKYSVVKTLAGASKVSFTDTKLKAGTKYYYKVKAYKTVSGKKVYGSLSTPVMAVTKTTAPTVTLKAGSKKATVSWKKVTGAAGYEVYMSTAKKGTYTKIKVASAKTTSLTKTGLKKGQTYYFKVRSYIRNASGKNVYSGYSGVKSVKVK